MRSTYASESGGVLDPARHVRPGPPGERGVVHDLRGGQGRADHEVVAAAGYHQLQAFGGTLYHLAGVAKSMRMKMKKCSIGLSRTYHVSQVEPNLKRDIGAFQMAPCLLVNIPILTRRCRLVHRESCYTSLEGLGLCCFTAGG